MAGSYTGTHLLADRGLRTLYVGYTATTLTLMLVGSGEAPDGACKAFTIYLNTPARQGAPADVALRGRSGTGGSPLAHKPTLDLQVDYGFRGVVGGATSGQAGVSTNEVYFSAVSYVTGTGTLTVGTDTYTGHRAASSGPWSPPRPRLPCCRAPAIRTLTRLRSPPTPRPSVQAANSTCSPPSSTATGSSAPTM